MVGKKEEEKTKQATKKGKFRNAQYKEMKQEEKN